MPLSLHLIDMERIFSVQIPDIITNDSICKAHTYNVELCDLANF